MDTETSADAAASVVNLEHERLTSLINSMADAVLAVDRNASIVLYNAASLNLFDVNTISVGGPLHDLFRPIDKDNQPVDIDAIVRSATHPMTSRDLRLGYPDGSTINIYVSIAPVHLGYGKSTTEEGGYVILLRDITREKSLEEERDEFISVVSHELRTPITIAEGNISNARMIMEKTGDSEAINKALTEAHHQVVFLSSMINDLSMLSRAERGRLQIEVEPIDVHSMVTELVNAYTPQAQAKGLQFISELDAAVSTLHSSKLYVHEILQNVITNALKYTQQGSITLRTQADERGVHFAVQDTGIGIGKADQERVFDKFFRSETPETRQANGTGLGLYVTMKLTRLIHAEIELESELGKGSTFTVFIPNLQ
jgi:two-component system phosphate regulon sensor histidine kinase PhoR